MNSSNKLLWNDAHLKSFASELLVRTNPNQFWELNPNDEVEDLKNNHIRKMLMKFFPALGVHNLILGNSDNGMPTSTLVFVRGNRCEDLDVETLRTITYKIFNFMGALGDDLRGHLHIHRSKIFDKDAVRTIPDYEDVTPFCDTRNSAYRFFQNGWIEITKDGVSELKSYDDIPENHIVWNSSVIARDYVEPTNKELIQKKLLGITSDALHPDTGECITDKELRKELHQEYQQKLDEFVDDVPDTHFRDFVQNLSLNDANEFDKDALKRIELAIGYLCHRHHIMSARKYVLLVDKFYDGAPNGSSNGGNGKSLLVKCLGNLMNLTELDGKTFKKGKEDTAAFAPVTPATEICHIDDASQKFPTDCLFTRTTGDFHIRRLYKSPFSIPASNAPKIVVSSNHPFPEQGNSFRRREFIVEVGNHYRIQSELYQETPFDLHGRKHICSDEWDITDWSEFYKYVFECIGKYLASNGLPQGGESDYYKRARLIELVGNEEVFNYLLSKLDEYCETGEEVFAEKFYKDVRNVFPNETDEVTNKTIWTWFGECGKTFKKYPNRNKNGDLENQRLSGNRWDKWVDAGMEDWTNQNGEVPEKGTGRVQVFRVSSIKKPNTTSFAKPEFNRNPIQKKVTPPPHKEPTSPLDELFVE